MKKSDDNGDEKELFFAEKKIIPDEVFIWLFCDLSHFFSS